MTADTGLPADSRCQGPRERKGHSRNCSGSHISHRTLPSSVPLVFVRATAPDPGLGFDSHRTGLAVELAEGTRWKRLLGHASGSLCWFTSSSCLGVSRGTVWVCGLTYQQTLDAVLSSCRGAFCSPAAAKPSTELSSWWCPL